MRRTIRAIAILACASACALPGSMQITQRPEAALTGTHVLAIVGRRGEVVRRLEDVLRDRGFKIKRFASVAQMTEEASDGRVVQYNEASARYALETDADVMVRCSEEVSAFAASAWMCSTFATTRSSCPCGAAATARNASPCRGPFSAMLPMHCSARGTGVAVPGDASCSTWAFRRASRPHLGDEGHGARAEPGQVHGWREVGARREPPRGLRAVGVHGLQGAEPFIDVARVSSLPVEDADLRAARNPQAQSPRPRAPRVLLAVGGILGALAGHCRGWVGRVRGDGGRRDGAGAAQGGGPPGGPVAPARAQERHPRDADLGDRVRLS